MVSGRPHPQAPHIAPPPVLHRAFDTPAPRKPPAIRKRLEKQSRTTRRRPRTTSPAKSRPQSLPRLNTLEQQLLRTPGIPYQRLYDLTLQAPAVLQRKINRHHENDVEQNNSQHPRLVLQRADKAAR